MKRAKIFFNSCFTIAFTGLIAFSLNAQSCADGSYSYDDDILPILTASCGLVWVMLRLPVAH